MNAEHVVGSCLCGEVGYEISGNARLFQYCHCSRCRKFTGSAHAANLFVRPAQFSWSRGQDSVRTYAPENTKYFSTAFCAKCGSSLPWKNKAGTIVVVPAGSLDVHPGMEPVQNVFWASTSSLVSARVGAAAARRAAATLSRVLRAVRGTDCATISANKA